MKNDPWSDPNDLSSLPKTSLSNFTSYSLSHSSCELALAGMSHIVQAKFTRFYIFPVTAVQNNSIYMHLIWFPAYQGRAWDGGGLEREEEKKEGWVHP